MRTLIIAVALLALVGCAKKEAPTSATAAKRDIVGYIMLDAQVVVPQSSQAQITPPYLAPVEKVMTTLGDNVKKGQTLVQLSFPNAEAALKQASLSVQAAEAARATARTQMDGEVKAAQSALTAAQAAEKEAVAMQNEGATADVEGARAARIAADETLQDARSRMNLQLLPYQQQVDSAREDLREAQSGAKLASIRAPISGTVIQLDVQAGQEIGQDAKKVIITIVDLEAIEVHALIPSEHASIVKKDTEAVLTFKEVPDKQINAVVTRVTTMPAKDGNGVQYTAILDFKNEEGLVKPGVTLTMVGVKAGEKKNVLAIPADAVDKDDTGKPIVKVLKGEDWLPTVVEVGISDGKYTEIKSGLTEGATVQVTP